MANGQQFQCEMKNQRQASIKELDFPFEYRSGQQKACFGCLQDNYASEASFYAGSDRCGKDYLYYFSGSEGGW